MLPVGTRGLGTTSDATERSHFERLALLLPEGCYHSERSPQRHLASSRAVDSQNSAHALPVGWEQRIEPPSAGQTSRVFFIDHSSRSTTLVDPRSKAADAEVLTDESDASKELLLLASGVLPEQAVGPADFRAALHRALRQALSGLASEGIAAGGLHERRLQLQQHINRALLERLLGSPPIRSNEQQLSALNRRVSAFALCHAVPPSQPVDTHLLNSLLKHSSYEDLLSLYTSGFFGPKRRHLWRVLQRLGKHAAISSPAHRQAMSSSPPLPPHHVPPVLVPCRVC